MSSISGPGAVRNDPATRSTVSIRFSSPPGPRRSSATRPRSGANGNGRHPQSINPSRPAAVRWRQPAAIPLHPSLRRPIARGIDHKTGQRTKRVIGVSTSSCHLGLPVAFLVRADRHELNQIRTTLLSRARTRHETATGVISSTTPLSFLPPPNPTSVRPEAPSRTERPFPVETPLESPSSRRQIPATSCPT